MYQQADTHNPLGKRRWTSGLQGYVPSEAGMRVGYTLPTLLRMMEAARLEAARETAGWTGLGQTAASRSTSPTPVGSPPYAAPPGLMWVWKGMPDFSAAITASIKPPGWIPTIYYAWHLQKGPGFSATVLAEYYRQNPGYMARDGVVIKGGLLCLPFPDGSLVTTPSGPLTALPADVLPSAIDKLKAWLAEETIMAGYPNQWFVVGGVVAYFLLRKK